MAGRPFCSNLAFEDLKDASLDLKNFGSFMATWKGARTSGKISLYYINSSLWSSQVWLFVVPTGLSNL